MKKLLLMSLLVPLLTACGGDTTSTEKKTCDVRADHLGLQCVDRRDVVQ